MKGRYKYHLLKALNPRTLPGVWIGRAARIKSLYGESGLIKKINFSGSLVLLLLVGCSSSPPQTPAPVEDREVNARVRAPAIEESAGVQVYSLQNPAVKQLTAQAQGAERAGDLDQAGSYLERALRIQPRDPQVLQHMAEIKLQKEDYQQALNFAVRSYDSGPRVGEICSRNWRTISVAREHLQDASGASDAEGRASQCMNTKKAGF